MLPINDNIAGYWEKMGDSRFIIEPEIEVEVYRWYPYGQPKECFVEFQSPKEAPKRRFYPTKVLEALKLRKPADDYVEEMCRLGIQFLPEFESDFLKWCQANQSGGDLTTDKYIPTKENLDFHLAIFKSRHEGHQGVNRNFHRNDDFYGTEQNRGLDDFLVPGFNLSFKKLGSKQTGSDIINHIFESVTNVPISTSSEKKAGAQSNFPIFLRTVLDFILIQGFNSEDSLASGVQIEQNACKIAPALINEIDLANDLSFAEDNFDDYKYFHSLLTKKYSSKPADFQRWLKQEREKGYIRLLPGHTKLTGADRISAIEKGKRFFRVILWTSFQLMSRAYGVTVLQQWNSLSNTKCVDASDEEVQAFISLHAPRSDHGGIPIWFFGPNVIRWYIKSLTNLVWKAPHQISNSITLLIALYGATARNRRDIDARKKGMKRVVDNSDLSTEKFFIKSSKKSSGNTNAGIGYFDSPNEIEDVFADESTEEIENDIVEPTKGIEDVFAAEPNEEIGDDLAEKHPEIHSNICHCGGMLIRVEKPMKSESWWIVETECNRCYQEKTYRAPRNKTYTVN